VVVTLLWLLIFFAKHQLNLSQGDLVLTIGQEPDETIRFTLRYKFNNGTAEIFKKAEIIIIGVNTRFNLRHDIRTKQLIFKSLAVNPGIIKWDILFHNGNAANGKRFGGDTKEIQVFVGDINDFEIFDIRLGISQNESGKSCKRTRELQLRTQQALDLQLPGGQNF